MLAEVIQRCVGNIRAIFCAFCRKTDLEFDIRKIVYCAGSVEMVVLSEYSLTHTGPSLVTLHLDLFNMSSNTFLVTFSTLI